MGLKHRREMTSYPVLPVIMPSNLRTFKNGELNSLVLRDIHSPKGQLHNLAATAWNSMQLAAYFDKIDLNHVGAYRSLEGQKKLFHDRYLMSKTGRIPEVTRTYQSATWYLKKGVAPAGTPGTSNHGWGLAIDVASCSGKRLEWLLGDGFKTSNALKFGFSWEVKNGANAEAWHIRYFCGDKLPKAVLDCVEEFPSLDAR